MSTTHLVQQGEHLIGIAALYGFRDFRTIWEDPSNSELKEKRGNPNVLQPGDVVVIPDKKPKSFDRPAGQSHKFRVKVQDLTLRLRILDFDGEPLAKTACRIDVDGDSLEVESDEDGKVERTIPSTAKLALLTFRDPSVPFDTTVPIRIGHLDPVETSSGQRARLTNLGYLPPREDSDSEGADDEAFRIAVEEFQCDVEIPVSGELDPTTQAKLKEIHGC